MKSQDPHLIELFWGLQKAGLPLTLQDYFLLPQAWDAGFQPENVRQLKALCCRLWVKSLADKQKFEDYFERYLQTWNDISQEESLENLGFHQERNTETRQQQQQDLVSKLDSQPEKNTKIIEQRQQYNKQQKLTEITPEIPIRQIEETPEIEIGQAVVQPLPPNKQISWGKFTLDRDYLPINLRKLQQGWRYLRTPQREGVAKELDLNATIKRFSQQGFLLEPVMRASLANKTELVLLIDQSNSMMPFALLVKQLKETATEQGHLGDTKTYYFSNIPKDSLYRDSDLLDKQSLSQILPKLRTDRTVVIIISDAGAIRGSFNPQRIVFTEDFLQQIRPHVRQIAWLNPLPTSFWQGNTTARIARGLPMFPFTSAGWRDLISQLKGTTKHSGGYYPFAEERGREAINLEALENSLRGLVPPRLGGKGGDVEDMAAQEDNLSRYEAAIRNILGWANQGKVYLHFAYHAAFPLALTPNLLHYLRVNFALDIPWFAVSELLLSPLCHPAGYQLYEMNSTVRHLLLKLLKEDERFGSQGLEQLSDALLFYIQQGLEREESLVETKDLGEKPEWIALAYTKPNEVAKQLALALQQAYGGDKAEQIRRASLTATFAEPLVEAGFQPLLTYSQGINRLVRGYEEGAKEILQQLSQNLDIEGIKLTNTLGREYDLFPLDVVVAKITFDEEPAAPQQLEFETVTVNSSGQVIKTATHRATYYEEPLGDRIPPLIMMGIPEGEFMMGSPETELGRRTEESPQHLVKVAPFWLAQTLVTNAQWNFVVSLPQIQRKLISKDKNNENDHPVNEICWHDVMEFCARLSRHTGRDYRLPSEAEWEYACRAVIGHQSSVINEKLTVEEWNDRYHQPFHFGATITSELANYRGTNTYADEPRGEYRGRTIPVKSLPPNAFGLYDMHGQVWEWCADLWHGNYQLAPKDSRVWDEQNKNDNYHQIISEYLDDRLRVLRGGSWYYNPDICRSAFRLWDFPGMSNYFNGFRVACGG